jgi:hypothetical protein
LGADDCSRIYIKYNITKLELETNLQALRLKWPKKPCSNDKRWWEFKCDEAKAIRIKSELALMEKEKLNPSEQEMVIKKLFLLD